LNIGAQLETRNLPLCHFENCTAS